MKTNVYFELSRKKYKQTTFERELSNNQESLENCIMVLFKHIYYKQIRDEKETIFTI